MKYSNIINFKPGKTGISNLIIFKDPASDIIRVQVISEINTKMKVDIFDPFGGLIMETAAPLKAGTNLITLDGQ